MPIPIFGYNETLEDCSAGTPDSAMRLPRREAPNDNRARVARQGDPDRSTGGGAADVPATRREGMRKGSRQRAERWVS